MLPVFTSDPGHYREFLSVGAVWRGPLSRFFYTMFLIFLIFFNDFGVFFGQEGASGAPGGALDTPEPSLDSLGRPLALPDPTKKLTLRFDVFFPHLH